MPRLEARWSGAEQVIVGSPNANRNRIEIGREVTMPRTRFGSRLLLAWREGDPKEPESGADRQRSFHVSHVLVRPRATCAVSVHTRALSYVFFVRS